MNENEQRGESERDRLTERGFQIARRLVRPASELRLAIIRVASRHVGTRDRPTANFILVVVPLLAASNRRQDALFNCLYKTSVFM